MHNVSTNVYSSYHVLHYSLLLHDHRMTKTLEYAGLSVFNKYEDCWNILTGSVVRINRLGLLHFCFVIVGGSSAP